MLLATVLMLSLTLATTGFAYEYEETTDLGNGITVETSLTVHH